MSDSNSIAAIVITRNESANIKRCLDSLTWLLEVILVDSGSTDDTIEIAARYSNVTIIKAEWMGYSENKRLAVKRSSKPWILWVDADEEVTPELREELLKLSLSSTNYIAFDLPRKTYFMGEWVKHTGWYPGRVIRLFNRNFCDFNNNILHEGVEIKDPIRLGHLTFDINHFSYQSLYQYFDKMNFYGRYGAEELVRKGKKFNGLQLLINPWTTFVKFYFFKKGFLDGKKGFIISVGSAFSNFIKYCNFYYLTRKSK